MNTLIKDIISNEYIVAVLERNGFKYIGQLLVIHEHTLGQYPRIDKEAINVVASALFESGYTSIGSRQAHELPSVVLKHMARIARVHEVAEVPEDEDDFGYFPEDNSDSLVDDFDLDDL